MFFKIRCANVMLFLQFFKYQLSTIYTLRTRVEMLVSTS